MTATKHAKMTSRNRTVLLRGTMKAIRAWLAYDLTDNPARKLEALERLRLRVGDCFNMGFAEAEKELAEGES